MHAGAIIRQSPVPRAGWLLTTRIAAHKDVALRVAQHVQVSLSVRNRFVLVRPTQPCVALHLSFVSIKVDVSQTTDIHSYLLNRLLCDPGILESWYSTDIYLLFFAVCKRLHFTFHSERGTYREDGRLQIVVVFRSVRYVLKPLSVRYQY